MNNTLDRVSCFSRLPHIIIVFVGVIHFIKGCAFTSAHCRPNRRDLKVIWSNEFVRKEVVAHDLPVCNDIIEIAYASWQEYTKRTPNMCDEILETTENKDDAYVMFFIIS